MLLSRCWFQVPDLLSAVTQSLPKQELLLQVAGLQVVITRNQKLSNEQPSTTSSTKCFV